MGLDHSLSSRSLPLLATGRASSDVTNNERAQRSTDPRARAPDFATVRIVVPRCIALASLAHRAHSLAFQVCTLLQGTFISKGLRECHYGNTRQLPSL